MTLTRGHCEYPLTLPTWIFSLSVCRPSIQTLMKLKLCFVFSPASHPYFTLSPLFLICPGRQCARADGGALYRGRFKARQNGLEPLVVSNRAIQPSSLGIAGPGDCAMLIGPRCCCEVQTPTILNFSHVSIIQFIRNYRSIVVSKNEGSFTFPILFTTF